MDFESGLPLLNSFSQLDQRLFKLLLIRHPAVPLWEVLHKTDSLAFSGAGNNYNRSPVNFIRVVESVQDCGHIVTVNLDYMPVERSPLIGDRFCWHYMLRGSGLLNAVIVHDDCQIVQAELRPQQQTFPDHTRVQFAVAQNNIDFSAGPCHSSSQRHSSSDCNAVAQGACSNLHPWSFCWFRVALEAAVQCTKCT